MSSDNPAKHFVATFLIALVVYVIVYSAIEHRRKMRGPWQVTFTSRAGSSTAAILINQPAIGITNVTLLFQGAAAPGTNISTTLLFGQPREVPFDVPLGKCIFMDATFLPGTLTFRMFGHEIELLPRVLMIDHEEHAWRPGEVVPLQHIRTTNGPGAP